MNAAWGIRLDHEFAPHTADPVRCCRTAEPRHGDSPELRSIPDAGHPRSRGDGGGFHARRRCAEHRLGAVAGADRRHRRPLWAARHDDGRCRDLRLRAGRHGRFRRHHGTARLRRADRGGAVLHRFLAGADSCRQGGARSTTE